MQQYKYILFIVVFFALTVRCDAQNNYRRDIVQHYFQNQEFDKAILYLQNISDTTNQYLYDLGYAFFMEKDYANSLKYFNQILSKDPESIGANLYAAMLYESFSARENALAGYKKLLQLQPDNYRFWKAAARNFRFLKLQDSAFIYIEKSYELNPASAEVTIEYAEALYQKKLQDKAVKVINDFLKTDTTNDEVISKKVLYSFKNNDNKAVINWGNILLNRKAQTPAAYVMLAYTYLNIKEYDKVIAIYDFMENSDMNNESMLYCAALAFAAKKNYKQSNDLLDECLKFNINKTAVTYYRSKADNSLALKDFNKAVAYYDTSYYIFHDPLDLYYAGNIYDENFKNRTKALNYYKRYLLNSKKPSGEVETKIYNYVKEYINSKNR